MDIEISDMLINPLSTPQERNKAFFALPPNKQRVALMQDLIWMLQKNKVRASKGSYVTTICINNPRLHKDLYFSEHDMQEVLDEAIQPACEVCGIGGIFVSLVHLTNEEKFDYMVYGTNEGIGHKQISKSEKLRKYFSHTQLRLIESAFEGRSYTDEDSEGFESPKEEDMEKAFDFYRVNFHSGENLRLVAIARIIIANDGEFAL